MAKRIPKYKVPYTSSGHLCIQVHGKKGYVDGVDGVDDDRIVIWKENKPFMETFIIEEWSKSSYSSQILCRTIDGKRFQFSPKTLVSAIRKHNIIDQKITGEFIVSKQGKNYVVDVLEK